MQVYLIDAFTNSPGKGNRAGVVLDASGLTEVQMQEIARQVNVSETAFVLPADDETHEVKVRYFTPTKEVPICGHATIATHYLRAKLGGIELPRTLLSKTGAGILSVGIMRDSEGHLHVTMTQGTPTLEPPLDAIMVARITHALGIDDSEIDSPLPVQIASTGHSKFMVPIKHKDTLDRLTPDLNALKAISEETNCNGFYVLNTKRDDVFVCGRMFAPAIGISEDPVTGNANGPAGYYLYVHNKLNLTDSNTIRYRALQGEAIQKPGFVQVLLHTNDSGKPPIVQVQGAAVEAGEMLFTFNISGSPLCKSSSIKYGNLSKDSRAR